MLWLEHDLLLYRQCYFVPLQTQQLIEHALPLCYSESIDLRLFVVVDILVAIVAVHDC